MMTNRQTPKKWCFKFKLAPFGFSGEHFPVDNFKVSDNFILIKRTKNPENCVACILEEIEDENEASQKHIQKQIDMLDFVSIYNLFTPITLRFDDAGYQTISDITNIEKELMFMDLSIKGILTPERQKEASLRILKQLDQTKSLWKIYQSFPDNKLKKNITNALHYFFYGKKAERDEEKIVNLMTGFECLFLEDNRELSYKLSIRSSYLLNKYTNLDWESLFSFMRKMYSGRSKIVHEGELKSDIEYLDLQNLEKYLSICIRSYISFNETFDKKQKIIDLIEKGILGNEITLPKIDDF